MCPCVSTANPYGKDAAERDVGSLLLSNFSAFCNPQVAFSFIPVQKEENIGSTFFVLLRCYSKRRELTFAERSNCVDICFLLTDSTLIKIKKDVLFPFFRRSKMLYKTILSATLFPPCCGLRYIFLLSITTMLYHNRRSCVGAIGLSFSLQIRRL